MEYICMVMYRFSVDSPSKSILSLLELLVGHIVQYYLCILPALCLLFLTQPAWVELVLSWHACHQHSYQGNSYWWMLVHLMAVGLDGCFWGHSLAQLALLVRQLCRHEQCRCGHTCRRVLSFLMQKHYCNVGSTGAGRAQSSQFRATAACTVPITSENAAAEFILLPFCLWAIAFNDCLCRDAQLRSARAGDAAQWNVQHNI